MNKSKCIYTAFYTNLANYDGRSTELQLRREFLDCCIRSYKITNPNIQFIIDIIDEPISNTCDMYFDKMRRIKELNYLCDVLWVDCDTLCLQNIDEIFERTKMCAVHWVDHGTFLNVINGGLVYYPKRYLYDNWDWFCNQWINLLSRLYIQKEKLIGSEKFTGIHEQIPITNLLLKQIDESLNFDNCNLSDNRNFLSKSDVLLNYNEYNYNPILMHFYYDNCPIFSKDRGFSTIANKKILHLNLSVALSDIFEGVNIQFDYVHFANYIIDNLIGYIHDQNLLRKRCEELKISNEYIKISNTNEIHFFENPSLGLFKCYEVVDEEKNKYKSNGILHPGCFLADNWNNAISKMQLIKNIYSGEETFVRMPR